MSKNRIHLPPLRATDEAHYLNRRQFLSAIGFGAAAMAGLSPLTSCTAAPGSNKNKLLRPGVERADVLALYPAKRNLSYPLEQPLTDAAVAASHNNFYEFTTDKSAVWKLAQQFEPDPWSIEITGLCHKPTRLDIDELYKLADLEERTYRFRCVEAWAMDVPWTGYPLHKLLAKVQPKSDAKFVRFVTVNRPKQMPGIVSQGWYPWPYFEGLRMSEAMHELTLLCTGIYGRPLPRQHGAPFRIVVPWKYGYKGPKSIVKIELVAEQPKTFWETLEPNEYPFESNVNPHVPHPRWSQARETMIGTGEVRPTLMYNGYGEQVAGLYR